jgi:hypothetical protein
VDPDTALLVRLRRAGKVRRRDGPYELAHPETTRRFVRRIEDLARPQVNLAIRPKKRRKG